MLVVWLTISNALVPVAAVDNNKCALSCEAAAPVALSPSLARAFAHTDVFASRSLTRAASEQTLQPHATSARRPRGCSSSLGQLIKQRSSTSYITFTLLRASTLTHARPLARSRLSETFVKHFSALLFLSTNRSRRGRRRGRGRPEHTRAQQGPSGTHVAGFSRQLSNELESLHAYSND